ncbi:DnaJ domain-containing protein [Cloacibacterium sp.]|jgi:curved DNA-binding protein CbpA|uniref:DnaJ domain-containing protein n=1 Tax=Cloacibacterium sp. TaxID=1913682 RepID=UPI0035B130FD
MIKDYYKILGLSISATQNEIKQSYRKLAVFWHPDRNSNPIALEKMKEINEAYEILSDENKRKSYNKIYQEYFINSQIVKYQGQSEKQYNEEKEKSVKQKYEKEFNDLKEWTSNIQFSLKKFDKFLESSISKFDKPIENFSYYFPILIIILIIIGIIAVNLFK